MHSFHTYSAYTSLKIIIASHEYLNQRKNHSRRNGLSTPLIILLSTIMLEGIPKSIKYAFSSLQTPFAKGFGIGSRITRWDINFLIFFMACFPSLDPVIVITSFGYGHIISLAQKHQNIHQISRRKTPRPCRNRQNPFAISV